MSRRLAAVAAALGLLALAPVHARAAEETVEFGRFGKVAVYRQSPAPSEVVLFVSGDGGWNLGVIDMARALASLDALVAGLDIVHYLRALDASGEACSYPAADFEALSKYIQKRYGFAEYRPPVLVGYSSGATLVYAALAQAPPNTFRGALSLGFCPDLPLSRPLCRGYGLEWTELPLGKGYSFLPAANLSSPWIAFQGTVDQVCFAPDTEKYVRAVPRGEIILLPKVGHGFSVQRNWMPQFRQAYGDLLAAPTERTKPLPAAQVGDLPLVEVPASGTRPGPLAVIVTGDGGWASLDRDVGRELASNGVPVVGFDSLQYFWKKRTPEESARDLARVLAYYLPRWHREEALLIGYSLGADVLPFMAAGLSPDLLARVRMVVLLGPDRRASFEFHLTDWIEDSPDRESLAVLPELEKLRGKPMWCFYGQEEKESLCRDLDPGLAKTFRLAGAHHFGGRYREIAETILRAIQ